MAWSRRESCTGIRHVSAEWCGFVFCFLTANRAQALLRARPEWDNPTAVSYERSVIKRDDVNLLPPDLPQFDDGGLIIPKLHL